jgi:signal recognition particle GTPase
LDNPDGIRLLKKQTNRCTRIARGAGVLIRDVKELIEQYSKLSGLVRSMGGISGIYSIIEAILHPGLMKLDESLIHEC